MHKVTVVYEPPSQRRNHRLTSPVKAVISDVCYQTKDWGLGGFSIEDFEGYAVLGDRLDVQFYLNFQGFEISFPASAEVVRISDSSLAAKFIDLGERESDLLKHFVSGIVNGEIVPSDDVLKRIDRPVTMVPGVPKPEPTAEKKRRFQQLAIAGGYVVVGLLVGGYLLLTLLGFILRLDIQTAVIGTPLEQIVSQDLGSIAESYVQVGTAIRAGQPLLRLRNELVTRDVQLARQELDKSRIDLQEIESKREQELKKLRAYEVISQDQLDSTNARVLALTAERDVEKIELGRIKQLRDDGLTTPKIYDRQKAVLAQQEGALQQALAEQKIAQTSIETTAKGFFFSGNFLVGDLPTFLAGEAAARERVKVAQIALQQALERETRLLYRAPYDGAVTRLFKSPGMTVDRGEAILVLRRANGDRYIDAYLTQDQVGYLQVGTRGLAYIPAWNKGYAVEVAIVDRTAGFLKDVQTPKLVQPLYNWRGIEDPSAYAKLTFVGMSPAERALLSPGLPVRVNLPKRRCLPFPSMLHSFGQSDENQQSSSSPPPASQPNKGNSAEGKLQVALASILAPGVAFVPQQRAASFPPRLWPSDSPLFSQAGSRLASDREFQPVRQAILDAADRALRMPPAPVEALHSAGVTNQSDPALLQTRRAFQDADRFVLLAVAYSLTGKGEYLNRAREILLAWANVNRPTGNPIDETRLEGFLWGLDLIRGKLNDEENQSVTAWLERWEAANRSWHFGPNTEHNNHKTHHLKILLMLDRLLNRSDDLHSDLAQAQNHLAVNLRFADGSSVDYHERDALHYHVYDLEAWIEISLVTGCCQDAVDRAFAFLQRSVEQNPEHTEFAASKAPIDKKRAEAGFKYAQPHPYDLRQAAGAIFSYATLPGRHVDAALWQAAIEGEQQKNLFYRARYYLWRTP